MSDVRQHLQSVQIAAAWLVFRIRRSEHITTIFDPRFHLPCISENISFKLAVLKYRADLSTAVQLHLVIYSRTLPT